MQSTPTFPSLNTNQQSGVAYNAFPPSPHSNQSYQPGLNNNQNQSWDRLAVEANLQDYRQVHVHPDLVAPAIPAAFFPNQSQPQSFGYDNKSQEGQLQSQSQAYRAPPSYPVSHGAPQQRYPPYMPYQSSFDNSMGTSSFQQASPLPTSSRSSPSSHSHTLITPQSATHPIVPDMSWSTQYMNAQPQMQGLQHANTVAPPSTRPQSIPQSVNCQSIYTGYQPVTKHSGSRANDSSASAPPVALSEQTRLAASNGSMNAMPIAHSQSLPGPGPSAAINMNGMWSREMHFSASSASGPGSSTQVKAANQHTRSPAQIKRSPFEGLPTSLPQAPVISKRSRSPHQSQGSSSSNGYSPGDSSTATDQKSKRPKLSIPHPMPSLDYDHDHDHDHDHDDEEKKVVIACHTCRARKLK